MIHTIGTIRDSATLCKKIYAESEYSIKGTQFDLYHRGGNNWDLTYRGTDELIDWINNLDFRLVTIKHLTGWNVPGRMSAGFWEAFKPSIEVVAELPLYSNVFLRGHSLGHSEALSACVYLSKVKMCSHIQGVTFGGPRTGDAEFCNYINSVANITCVRRAGDIVPLIPPYLNGYRHAGNHYGSMPKMTHRAWLQLARVWGSTPDFTDPALVAEHVMDAYIRDLS